MNGSRNEATATWPGDPVAAWTEAGASPAHWDRFTDPPAIGSIDAIAARLESHGSRLWMIALVCAISGAAVVAALIVRVVAGG